MYTWSLHARHCPDHMSTYILLDCFKNYNTFNRNPFCDMNIWCSFLFISIGRLGIVRFKILFNFCWKNVAGTIGHEGIFRRPATHVKVLYVTDPNNGNNFWVIIVLNGHTNRRYFWSFLPYDWRITYNMSYWHAYLTIHSKREAMGSIPRMLFLGEIGVFARSKRLT